MPPLEDYLKHADSFAQDVVIAWATNMLARNADAFSDDFKAVFDKACRYRDAKHLAEERHKRNVLSERDTDEEMSTMRAFAEAYKTYWEKKQGTAKAAGV